MLLRPYRALVALTVLVSVLAGCSGPAGPAATSSQVQPTPTGTATATATAAPTSTMNQGPALPPGVTLAATLPFRPSGILVLGDVLWAEDHASTSAFYAVELPSGNVLATLPGSRPCDLVAAYDRVWLVDLGAGTLLSVDPTTMKVVDTIGGSFQSACGPQAAGDAIWLAADPGFARVDIKTKAFSVTDTGGGTFPIAGAPTPSRKSIWGVRFGDSELVKIDIASGKVVSKMPPPGPAAEQEAALVAFDSLWVGSTIRGKVYRLDPEDGSVKAEIASTKPARFAASRDSVWVSSYESGIVQRIDPKTNTVVFSARLGRNINGIAVGPDAIWAVDTASGKLFRIDPTATIFG